MQVRLNTDLEKLFHVRTDFNPADIGTRPSKVKDDDVGPNSRWENGLDWMEDDMEVALVQDIVKPAKDLKLKDDEELDYDSGLIFERCPEILIRGHHAFASVRVEKMAAEPLSQSMC